MICLPDVTPASRTLPLTRRANAAVLRWLECETLAERCRCARWCGLCTEEVAALTRLAQNVAALGHPDTWARLGEKADWELRAGVEERLLRGLALVGVTGAQFVQALGIEHIGTRLGLLRALTGQKMARCIDRNYERSPR